MKKLVLVGVFGLIVQTASQAQSENFRFGLRLSPTISWMSTDNDRINRTGSNIGIGIGAVGEYYISEHFALTAGLALDFNRGGTLQHEDGGNLLPDSELSDDALNSGVKPLPDGIKIKYRIQYLQLPFGLKFRTAENGYLRYYGEFPILSFGFRTQARADLLGGDIDASDENVAGDVAAMNVSFSLGGGVEYALSENTSLVAGLYADFGLVDVTRNDGITAMNNPNQAPSNPTDDYILQPEDSKGKLSAVSLRIAILF